LTREGRKDSLLATGGAFTPRARAFLERLSNPLVEKPFDAAALRVGLARVTG
jgi:hypothetical protein